MMPDPIVGPIKMIDTPPNTLQRIDTLWAWVSVDKTGEGLLAAEILGPGNGVVPLLAADKARLDGIRPWAVRICEQSGMTARLIEFSTRRVVDEIHPSKPDPVLDALHKANAERDADPDAAHEVLKQHRDTTDFGGGW